MVVVVSFSTIYFHNQNVEVLRTAFTELLTSFNVHLSKTQYWHYHAGVIKNFLLAAHSVWDESTVAVS